MALVAALVAAACGGRARAPQLTHVPDFPAGGARPHAAAWAAFDLPLRNGSVHRERVRTLGWDASGGPVTLFTALRAIATGTRWDAAVHADGVRHTVVVVDGRGQVLEPGDAPHAIRKQVDMAQKMRRVALAALSSGSRAREHDLDCAWMTLATLRSGAPFLHDDVRGWTHLEPQLGVAEDEHGGLWVCRVPRSTHQGQFVFLDVSGAILGIREYILGE